MKYLSLPHHETRILPFYLAMEEYAARIMGQDDIFFMWQVRPTVIFGRNQLIDNEVNLDYCREHGIEYYRRKSGGGCVFADMNNIMFSYITRSDNVELTYSRYTHAVVAMLRQLGLDASDNGRNDILISGQKVSGNAFYHLPGRSIVHGTMLYDTDMTHITHAITPSKSKLESKGVKSVASRITTIRQHSDIGLEDFKAHVRRTLCDGEIELNERDIVEIEQIMQTYLAPEFILGNNPRCNLVKQGRIEGVGELQVSLELNRNRITAINLAGDYFLVGDLDDGLLNKLHGVQFTHQALTDALDKVEVRQIILNLSTNQFINFLTD
ncbi:MAG: lipoate--protein ligase [Muribaculaceae bacterium]|nr:lipoate--protein ligase [Muribaculaceae bacterium]